MNGVTGMYVNYVIFIFPYFINDGNSACHTTFQATGCIAASIGMRVVITVEVTGMYEGDVRRALAIVIVVIVIGPRQRCSSERERGYRGGNQRLPEEARLLLVVCTHIRDLLVVIYV
jgi:hypothetical protein